MIHPTQPSREDRDTGMRDGRRCRVLLTGATGLVGRGVLEALFGRCRVERLGRGPECEYRGDLGRFEEIATLSTGPLDAVVHCGNVTDEDFAAAPAAALDRAVRGTQALVELARRAGARRFVLVSTAHVYGPLTGIVDESRPADPRSDYAIAHFAAEQVVRRAALAGHFAAVALRPCAVFGTPLPLPLDGFRRWSLIPFGFPLQAVREGHIRLRGTGEERRNFVSAADIGRAAAAWLGRDDVPAWDVVNPVGVETLSVWAFAQLCAGIAAAVTGRRCETFRAEPGAETPGADFEYRSLRSGPAGTDRLPAAIEALTAALSANMEATRRYAS